MRNAETSRTERPSVADGHNHTTGTSTAAADCGELPLAGVTVVSLEQAVAAPLAGRHLADLGARVIKVERIGEGDFARSYDAAVHGLASHFVWLNRGKESVALDLKDARGLAVLLGVDTEAGPIRAVLPPMTFDDVQLRMDAVPALGQHTDAVLTELGHDATQIAALRAAGSAG